MSTLRFRSKKMAKLYRTERIPLVQAVLANRPNCEAQLLGCTGRSTEVHEVKSRARGGSITDIANVKALCHACHQWITEHPHEAHVSGMSQHSWAPDGRCAGSPTDYIDAIHIAEIMDEEYGGPHTITRHRDHFHIE